MRPADRPNDTADPVLVQLTDCAELDADDQVCLAPAVVHRLAPVASTSGPIELVTTRCLHGHVLRMPASMLVGAG